MVLITHDDGYLEGIQVRGRESQLMDDLEYTKAAISMENIVGPLLQSISEQLDSPPKKETLRDTGKIKTEQGDADERGPAVTPAADAPVAPSAPRR